MALQSIYDIYNETLEQDQPYVDQIVAAVESQLEINIANNINTFDVDVAVIIGALPLLQQNRILDMSIYMIRSKGIGVNVKNPNTNDDENLFEPGYNFNYMAPFQYLSIRWTVRNNNEYMKTYC